MRVDLHNHTTLCNHANGTMREYILKAIDLGIDIYGFSEHAPMDFDEGYRLPLSQKAFYENEVLTLKNEFKNEIDIVLGYEVDFMQHVPMKKEILNANVDYLIGSVHFLDGWGFDNPEFIGAYKDKDIDTIWQDYFDAIEAMANSSLFDIVGHLDLIKVFKFLPKKDIRLIAKKALLAIKKANMCVEINAAGFRKPIGEQYPSKELLECCFESDIPITFSSDAHEIAQIGFSYDKAIELAKAVGYFKCASYKNRERVLHTF
ncbi:MAG: histidinol-phosphatase [Candidatus Marinarcus sp.]|uniref:histidinol-phosphatase n=1 Tax=Candidatus Marinarcus sp. TaxID=3100987 RepID=UPI003B008472